jgi:hypothetical protein
MELVHGYYCRDCGDVELAKKGIDPTKSKQTNGVGGSAGVDGANASKPELGVNKVSATGDVGRSLNLYA